jgi:glutamate synthase (ferredoxin)
MDAGKYGVGMFFLPRQEDTRKHCEEIIENIIETEKLEIFGWRTVPTNDHILNGQDLVKI